MYLCLRYIGNPNRAMRTSSRLRVRRADKITMDHGTEANVSRLKNGGRPPVVVCGRTWPAGRRAGECDGVSVGASHTPGHGGTVG